MYFKVSRPALVWAVSALSRENPVTDLEYGRLCAKVVNRLDPVVRPSGGHSGITIKGRGQPIERFDDQLDLVGLPPDVCVDLGEALVVLYRRTPPWNATGRQNIRTLLRDLDDSFTDGDWLAQVADGAEMDERVAHGLENARFAKEVAGDLLKSWFGGPKR